MLLVLEGIDKEGDIKGGILNIKGWAKSHSTEYFN